MKRIVILISGRGSNMEAIVEACARESWNARVAAVISNRPEAAGLAFAAARGMRALLLGSETQKVLTHSAVAVLVVR